MCNIDIERLSQSMNFIDEFSNSDFQRNHFDFEDIYFSQLSHSIPNDSIKNKNKQIFFKTENILSIFTPKLGEYVSNNKETEAETLKNKEKVKKITNNKNNISKAKIKRIIKNLNTEKKKRNRKKNIIRRRENTYNIRIKTLSKFFRSLIKSINYKLTLIEIKKKFKLLSVEFVRKYISKVLNEKDKSKVDFTFGQIISKNIFDLKEKEKLYEENLEVLNCLKNSKINIFEKKKFSQLLGEYLNSEEFNNEIFDKKENDEKYINRCKNKIREFLNIFKNYYEKNQFDNL